MLQDSSSFEYSAPNPHLGNTTEIDPFESLQESAEQRPQPPEPIKIPEDIPKAKLEPAQLVTGAIVKETDSGQTQLLPRLETRQQELFDFCVDPHGDSNEAIVKLTQYIAAGGKHTDFSPEQLVQYPLLREAVSALEQGLDLVALADNADALAEDGTITDSQVSPDKKTIAVNGKNNKRSFAQDAAITCLFLAADTIFFGGRTASLLAENFGQQIAEHGVDNLFEKWGIKKLDKKEKESFIKGILEASSTKSFEDFILKASESTIYEYFKLFDQETREKILNGQPFGGFSGTKLQLSQESHKEMWAKLNSLSDARKQDLGLDKIHTDQVKKNPDATTAVNPQTEAPAVA